MLHSFNTENLFLPVSQGIDSNACLPKHRETLIFHDVCSRYSCTCFCIFLEQNNGWCLSLVLARFARSGLGEDLKSDSLRIYIPV